MKILLATYWAIPHVGGVWNYMQHLKQNLEKNGHEVDLLGFGEDNSYVHIVNKDQKLPKSKLLPLLEAKLNKDDYPEIHANGLVKYTEFQRYVFELSAAYFGLDRYDIIHAQDVISASSLDRVRPKNTALVATLHGSVAHEIRHQLESIHQSETSFMAKEYYDMLEQMGAKAGEYTIVANNWLKNILTSEFATPEDQIEVLHYGYDVQSFLKQMKTKLKIEKPLDKKVIMYTGRLVDMKGVQHLLSALHLLKQKREDWVCWIIGDGDSIKSLQAQAIELELDDYVLFFGQSKNIPSLLTLSDIYVFPSLIENQPLSVIEAQIAGKPVIVSDAGGLPEIVEDGVTGFITPAKDSQALSDKMELLLTDDKLRKKLGSNAKKWGFTHWSPDKEVKQLLSIYKQAINKVDKE